MKNNSPLEVKTERGNIKYLPSLRELSRTNRKNPTNAEELFWELLNYQKTGYKFVRQKPIGKFILDFYCSKLLLDIEIDGDSHDHKKFHDVARDQILQNMNILTVRFKNEEVLNNINQTRTKLYRIVNKRFLSL